VVGLEYWPSYRVNARVRSVALPNLVPSVRLSEWCIRVFGQNRLCGIEGPLGQAKPKTAHVQVHGGQSKRARRSVERVVQSLKNAGKSGLTVKDLASKLGKSYGNVSVWFHTTAKGINQIKKVEPGRFAWAA
jgi:hypothetical protein